MIIKSLLVLIKFETLSKWYNDTFTFVYVLNSVSENIVMNDVIGQVEASQYSGYVMRWYISTCLITFNKWYNILEIRGTNQW